MLFCGCGLAHPVLMLSSSELTTREQERIRGVHILRKAIKELEMNYVLQLFCSMTKGRGLVEEKKWNGRNRNGRISFPEVLWVEVECRMHYIARRQLNCVRFCCGKFFITRQRRLRVENKFGLVMLERLDLTTASRLLTIVLWHIEDVCTASNAKHNDATATNH